MEGRDACRDVTSKHLNLRRNYLVYVSTNTEILCSRILQGEGVINLAEAAGDPNRKQTNQLHGRFSENIVLLVAGYCRNSRTGEI